MLKSYEFGMQSGKAAFHRCEVFKWKDPLTYAQASSTLASAHVSPHSALMNRAGAEDSSSFGGSEGLPVAEA